MSKGALAPICEIVAEDARLVVEFGNPEYGWINLRVPSLAGDRPLFCSETADPFPAMMVWLHQIAVGRAAAAWEIGEEGSSANLVFLNESDFVGGEGARLLLCIGDHGGIAQLCGMSASAHDVVAAFYGAFRTMTGRADYQPGHWEAHPDYMSVEMIEDEAEYEAAHAAYPFRGTPLRAMRSEGLEAFIADSSMPVSAEASQPWDGYRNGEGFTVSHWDSVLTDPRPLTRTAGQFFRDDIMPYYRLSVAGLARAIGVNRANLHNVLSGKASLSPELAWRLGAYLYPDLADLLLAYDFRWTREQGRNRARELGEMINPLLDA